MKKIVLAGVTKDAAEEADVLRLTRTGLQTVIALAALLLWFSSCLLPLPSR
jgi:hypothetical protein